MTVRFKLSETLRNVSTLVAGTGIAQAILLAASPFLTRLYEPSHFATLTLFTSLVAIVSVIGTSRFEFAVMLPAEDGEARQVMRLAMSICATVTALMLVCIAGYDLLVPGSWRSASFAPLFYLAPAAVFLTGLYNVFNFWSTRQRTFMINASARVSASVGYVLVGVGYGLLNRSATGLILASFTSYLVSALVCGHRFILRPALFFLETSRRKVKEVYKKYRDFAVVNTPHALVDVLVDNGLFFLLAYFFAPTIVGWYAFSFRLLKAPAGLIGSSLYQVLFQRMSAENARGADLRPMVIRVYKNLLLFATLPFLAGVLFAPQVFAFVFGSEWKGAGEVARIILPWIFFNFLITPLSFLPLLRGRQRTAFLMTLIDMVLRFSGIIMAGLMNNPDLAFAILSFMGSSVMIFGLFWYYRLAKPVPVPA
jgi:lipopolysaccharide exporter